MITDDDRILLHFHKSPSCHHCSFSLSHSAVGMLVSLLCASHTPSLGQQLFPLPDTLIPRCLNDQLRHLLQSFAHSHLLTGTYPNHCL